MSESYFSDLFVDYPQEGPAAWVRQPRRPEFVDGDQVPLDYVEVLLTSASRLSQLGVLVYHVRKQGSPSGRRSGAYAPEWARDLLTGVDGVDLTDQAVVAFLYGTAEYRRAGLTSLALGGTPALAVYLRRGSSSKLDGG